MHQLHFLFFKYANKNSIKQFELKSGFLLDLSDLAPKCLQNWSAEDKNYQWHVKLNDIANLRNRSAPVRELLSNNSLFGGQL